MSQPNVLAFPAPIRLSQPEPAEYFINEDDRERYGERHVRLGKEMGRSGEFAFLWRESGKRGGGTIASILPVLALHAYPTETNPRFLPPELPPPDSAFTPWTYLSTRRFAKLSGLGKDTAWRALRSAGRLGLLEHQTISCRDSAGGRKTFFRLNRKLFAGVGEEYAAIPGALIYSGTWMILPTPASRHLYLLLAMLDPIYSEQSLREFYESADGLEDTNKQIRKIREIREAHAVSWSTLMRLSGLSRGALREALSVLLTPLFEKGTLPLVSCGGKAGSARWYAIEKKAASWHYLPDYLNEHTLQKIRRDIWKGLAQPKKKPRNGGGSLLGT